MRKYKTNTQDIKTHNKVQIIRGRSQRPHDQPAVPWPKASAWERESVAFNPSLDESLGQAALSKAVHYISTSEVVWLFCFCNRMQSWAVTQLAVPQLSFPSRWKRFWDTWYVMQYYAKFRIFKHISDARLHKVRGEDVCLCLCNRMASAQTPMFLYIHSRRRQRCLYMLL